ncbi:rhodanese-like domain-containing protein [Desulfovibrio legallii]|uniref:Rhodanese-related sulfurtransferase n=1 Tax=Desulfovibrio legallii TaxID=571438 RepID=A0A1G7MBI9_9BACT|nr:rhodanese-like domain-containing protein [Desulfovibrio legallii]SDF59051.1 Rhodanese-related sulfurtransferase [Desulfovibrio legallii]
MRHTALQPFRLAWALCALVLLLTATAALAKDIGVQEAAALLRRPPDGLVVLDVRTPAEYRAGHLPGAVNMDYFGGPFETQIQSLPKDAPVLLYCRTGNRSQAAQETLLKAGIRNILHMKEGVSAWQAQGLPLEK